MTQSDIQIPNSKTVREILNGADVSFRDIASVWLSDNIKPKQIITLLKHYYKNALEVEDYHLTYAALFGIYTTYIIRYDDFGDKSSKILKNLPVNDFGISNAQKISVVDKMLDFVEQDEFFQNILYFRDALTFDSPEIESKISILISSKGNPFELIEILQVFRDYFVLFNRDSKCIGILESKIRMLDYGYEPSLLLMQITNMRHDVSTRAYGCDNFLIDLDLLINRLEKIKLNGDELAFVGIRDEFYRLHNLYYELDDSGIGEDEMSKEINWPIKEFIPFWKRALNAQEFIPSWRQNISNGNTKGDGPASSVDYWFEFSHFENPNGIWSFNYVSQTPWPTLTPLEQDNEHFGMLQIGDTTIFDQ